MIGLYILAAVVCVLLILLFSRVKLTVEHNTAAGDEPKITLSYLFLKFRLSPKPAPRVKLRDYTYKNFQKSEKKRLKKEAKATEKAKVKAEKKEAAKKAKSDAKAAAKKARQDAKKAPVGSQPKTEDVPKQKKSVVSFIWEIKHLLLAMLKKFPSKLRLDVTRLKLRVGGKDAATAAITYGAVTEAVGALLAVLESFMKVKRGAEHEIEIVPDFLSGKIDADVLIRVSIAPAGALSVVFGFIGGLISHYIKKIKNKSIFT